MAPTLKTAGLDQAAPLSGASEASRPKTAPGPAATCYRAIGRGIGQVGPWREFMTLAALDAADFCCAVIETGAATGGTCRG